MYDYFTNEKYIFECITFHNETIKADDSIREREDNELNPYINLTFYFYFKDLFYIYDKGDNKFIEMEYLFDNTTPVYNIRKRVTDMDIGYILNVEKMKVVILWRFFVNNFIYGMVSFI